MTDGLSTVNFANALLNTINNTSFAIGATWVQLHTGSPGPSGTANLSAVTTREQAVFSAAASGSIGLSASPTAWNMTTTETITDVSVWTLSSSGLFLWSAALAVEKTVSSGDTLTLNTCTLSLSPLAA